TSRGASMIAASAASELSVTCAALQPGPPMSASAARMRFTNAVCRQGGSVRNAPARRMRRLRERSLVFRDEHAVPALGRRLGGVALGALAHDLGRAITLALGLDRAPDRCGLREVARGVCL